MHFSQQSDKVAIYFQGQAAGFPPNQSRKSGQTPDVSGGASGTNGPTKKSVNDMSVGDLIKMLHASGLSESDLSTIYKTSE